MSDVDSTERDVGKSGDAQALRAGFEWWTGQLQAGFTPTPWDYWQAGAAWESADSVKDDQWEARGEQLQKAYAQGRNDAREALARLERAVDWFIGRSAFTQTRELKGMEHANRVREELYAAHDAARAALGATCPASPEDARSDQQTALEKSARLMNETGQGEHLGVGEKP